MPKLDICKWEQHTSRSCIKEKTTASECNYHTVTLLQEESIKEGFGFVGDLFVWMSTTSEISLWMSIDTLSHFHSHCSSQQTYPVASDPTKTEWPWLSEQYAALVHYAHMITWPFPQRMSLIRSRWRSQSVCNCFPLGETVTAIESLQNLLTDALFPLRRDGANSAANLKTPDEV